MPDVPRASAWDVHAGVDAAVVRWHVPLLIALCALLFLPGIGSLPLIDQEEARCAQIVREMIRGGDWLMPHFAGVPYFDKPAPFFWLAAASEWVTGNAALGGRLVAAVAALLTVLTTYAVGRRKFGPTVGLIAAVVLATSAQFWFMARWYRMDMPFAAAMWAAVAWFWLHEPHGESATRVARWIVWSGFYFCCALATLFKGPAGLGLPVLIVAGYLALVRRPRRILEMFDSRGIAVFVLVAAPWYALVSLQHPSYVYEFIFRQNMMRFGTSTFGHSWPGVLFVPILLLGLLPWTLWLLTAAKRHPPLRFHVGAPPSPTLLPWLAALIPLVFFSFSQTKLAGYILPCFAPLAVIVARPIAEWLDRGNEDWSLRVAAVGVIVLSALLWLGVGIFEARLTGLRGSLSFPAVSAAATALVLTGCLARQRRRAFAYCSVLTFAALLTFVAVKTEPIVYERLTTRSLANMIPAADRTGDRFLMWPKARYSFVYYVDAPEPDQVVHFGQSQMETVVSELQGSAGVYVLVVGEENLRALHARLPSVTVVGHTGNLWLLSSQGSDRPGKSG